MSAKPAWRFRDWLSVFEAAEYLAKGMSGYVSVNDVYRLGLEGRLRFCLHLPVPVIAIRIGTGDDDPGKIVGLCDLTMDDAAREQIEVFAHDGQNYPTTIARGPCLGAVVEQAGATYRFVPKSEKLGRPPTSSFPATAILGIRRRFLDDLVEEGRRASAPPPEPLETRERTTLVCIIAGLAKAKGIDMSQPTKASELIEAFTEGAGARVSWRTILDVLKLIPDAIERRS